MWNYSFILPGVMMLLIILSFYFLRPRLPIRMNREFVRIVALDICTLVADVVSSLLDERYATTPRWLLWAANMIFFLFFFARVYSYFIFTVDVLDQYRPFSRAFRKLAVIPVILCQLITLSSLWTRAVFWIDETGYHSGPWYNLLYVCYFGYLAFTFLLIFIRWKQIPRFDRISLIGYNIVLLAGILARIFRPTYLILNTFCIMAILVIYISFENQERYLSERFKAYNADAFRVVLGEWHGRRKYRMFAFAIWNYTDMRDTFGLDRMDAYMSQIIRFLRELCKGGLVFYLGNGRFATIRPEELVNEQTPELVRARFQHPWKAGDGAVKLDIAFVRAPVPLTQYPAEQVADTLLSMLNDIRQTDVEHDRELHEVIEENERIQAVRHQLHKALKGDSAEVYLQPIVRAKTGEPVGAEALVRIPDGKGGLIPPSLFIGLAEREGQISQLGEQVLRKVCAFLRDHHEKLPQIHWINVNLSPVQCLQDNLTDRFIAILESYGVSPELIHLEITEETMVDSEKLGNQLKTLQEHGFQFSLDDYGSGYSNLIRLMDYSFRNIKIDMHVVRSYAEKPNRLLPEVIRTFKDLSFDITAEGVEEEKTVRALAEVGCDYMQGFYFSNPVPMEDFVKAYGTGPTAEAEKR